MLLGKRDWVPTVGEGTPPINLCARQGHSLREVSLHKKDCEYFFSLTGEELSVNGNAVNYITWQGKWCLSNFKINGLFLYLFNVNNVKDFTKPLPVIKGLTSTAVEYPVGSETPFFLVTLLHSFERLLESAQLLPVSFERYFLSSSLNPLSKCRQYAISVVEHSILPALN